MVLKRLQTQCSSDQMTFAGGSYSPAHGREYLVSEVTQQTYPQAFSLRRPEGSKKLMACSVFRAEPGTSSERACPSAWCRCPHSRMGGHFPPLSKQVSAGNSSAICIPYPIVHGINKLCAVKQVQNVPSRDWVLRFGNGYRGPAQQPQNDDEPGRTVASAGSPRIIQFALKLMF